MSLGVRRFIAALRLLADAQGMPFRAAIASSTAFQFQVVGKPADGREAQKPCCPLDRMDGPKHGVHQFGIGLGARALDGQLLVLDIGKMLAGFDDEFVDDFAVVHNAVPTGVLTYEFGG